MVVDGYLTELEQLLQVVEITGWSEEIINAMPARRLDQIRAVGALHTQVERAELAKVIATLLKG